MVVVNYEVHDEDGGCLVELIVDESRLFTNCAGQVCVTTQGGPMVVSSVRPCEVETEQDVYNEMKDMGLRFA
jgi:hypothetical protein